jgi:prepilin-type N-terminal cleavage/methylation domain-containing protein
MKNLKGFTLIEILIVLVLMSVLAGALLTLQFILTQNQIVVWQSYVGISEANNNVSALVREARTLRYANNGDYPLQLADDNELIFFSDIDYDGSAERIRYFLVGTDLTKGVIEPTAPPISYPTNQEKVKVVSENVRNAGTPIFEYYNQDWPEDLVNNPLSTPANPSDVKLVKIHLRLNTVSDKPDKDFILESYTQLRTLKENL